MINKIGQTFRLKPATLGQLKTNWLVLLLLLLISMVISGCGNNGFHLRKPVTLDPAYQQLRIEGLENNHRLFAALDIALQEAGARVDSSAPQSLRIRNLREGRRVVAYTSERKAREYLIYLKFDYSLSTVKPSAVNLPTSREKVHAINLDRTFLYDANFVLGKTEEERQIREELYREAARLILLNIKYAAH